MIRGKFKSSRQVYFDMMRNYIVILVVIGHATYYEVGSQNYNMAE